METIHVIVETPRNSRAKYVWNEEKQRFFLKKALPLGMHFPYDFGFIPGTTGEDGDPLDALIISELETHPGVSIECRLIGVLTASQTGKHGKTIRNDRYLFIPEASTSFGAISNVQDFSLDHNRQLTEFFINYNRSEGKRFEPIDLLDGINAAQLLYNSVHK